MLLCKVCKKFLNQTKGFKLKLYCSKPCRDKAWRDLKRTIPFVRKCLFCSIEFSGRSDKKYCTRKCRDKAKLKEFETKFLPKDKDKQRQTFKCPFCKRTRRLMYAMRSKFFPFCTESCKIGYNTALERIGKTYKPSKFVMDDSLYVKRWEMLWSKAEKLPRLKELLKEIEKESLYA